MNNTLLLKLSAACRCVDEKPSCIIQFKQHSAAIMRFLTWYDDIHSSSPRPTWEVLRRYCLCWRVGSCAKCKKINIYEQKTRFEFTSYHLAWGDVASVWLGGVRPLWATNALLCTHLVCTVSQLPWDPVWHQTEMFSKRVLEEENAS